MNTGLADIALPSDLSRSLDDLPACDESLCREVLSFATGACIHDANGMVGVYQGYVDHVHTLAGRIRQQGAPSIRSWPTGI